jgi:DNA-binding PadR family transcriptional regulator
MENDMKQRAVLQAIQDERCVSGWTVVSDSNLRDELSALEKEGLIERMHRGGDTVRLTASGSLEISYD